MLLSSSANIDYISKDTIVISNRKEGDIFVFNGSGILLYRFNHRGQGNEEYVYMSNLVYNFPDKEIYVHTFGKTFFKIIVYDIEGNFKREIPLGIKHMLEELKSFDENTLIAYETAMFPFERNQKVEYNKSPMFLISKKAGAIDTLKDFKVPHRKSEFIYTFKAGSDLYIFETNNIIEKRDDFVLHNFFCDTVFSFNKSKKLTPIAIKRPVFNSMETIPLILDIEEVSSKYLFATVVEYVAKEGDKRMARICVNRFNNDIVEYALRNNDINDTEFNIKPHSVLITADKLKELLEEGKLSGKLKTIAEKLKEEDNPVVMKVTLKN